MHDLDALGGGIDRQWKPEAVVGLEGAEDVSSELFIARVVRVEDVPSSETEAKEMDDDTIRTLPLLYHRRRYATTRDLDKPLSSFS